MHVTCLARGWKQSPVRGHYPGIPCWDFRCHSVLLLCCCQGNEHMQISRSKTCNYKNEENIITEVLGSHSAIDVRLGPAASFVSVLAPCNDCSRKGVRPRHQSSGSPRRVARPRRSHWITADKRAPSANPFSFSDRECIEHFQTLAMVKIFP